MKKYLSKIGLIVIVAVISSCHSETDTILEVKESKVSSNLRVFSSQEELKKEISQSLNSELNDRIIREKSMGFRSFGSIADEIESEATNQHFETVEQIESFVNENQFFLQLLPDEDGELTLQTRLPYHPMRYVVNKDFMTQVGDRIYKIFDEGFVSLPIQDMKHLYAVKNLKMVDKSIPSIEITPFENLITNADSRISEDCGIEINLVAKNDGNKTAFYGQTYAISSIIAHFWQVDSYKKNLGIWFHKERPITVNIQFKTVHTIPIWSMITHTSTWPTNTVTTNRLRGENEFPHNGNVTNLLFSYYYVNASTHKAGVSSTCGIP